MATITSAQTGNFSSTSTWVGGVVPTSADDAVAANGHTVTIDTNVTVLSFQQAGTGKFVLGGGRTVTGNVIANAGTFTSGGTVEVTATTGQTATINGNVTGVSSTAANIAGIVMNSNGILNITGNVGTTSGNASSLANGHAGVYLNGNSIFTLNGNTTADGARKAGIWVTSSGTTNSVIINGNVTGGSDSGYGIYSLASNNTISITGIVNGAGSATSGFGIAIIGASTSVNVIGTVRGNDFGGGNNCHGISATGVSNLITITGLCLGGAQALSSGVVTSGSSASVTVTGDIIASSSSGSFGISATGASSTVNVVGSVTAAGTLSHGISCSATANGVIFQGNLIDSLQGATAIYSRLLRVTATNTGTTTYTNTVGYPNGTPVTRVSPDLTTGMPATNNVRSGTVYGFNSELTGAMAVPESQSVSFGVPVGNTTGTASLRPEDIAALVGAQVAAAVRDLN